MQHMHPDTPVPRTYSPPRSPSLRPAGPAHALSPRPARPPRTRKLVALQRTCAKLEVDAFFFLLALYPPALPLLWEGLAGLFLLFRAIPGVVVVATIGI